MYSKPLFKSTSKKRLEEFRSKLESNFTSKIYSRVDKQNTIQYNRRSSPYTRLKDLSEDLQRSITPKKLDSPKLNHYRNLSNFKTQNPSPKAQSKQSNDLFHKFELSNNFASTNENKRKEKLCELIPIETLSTATNIISRGGIKTVSRVYSSQLREFCTEVLANLR